MSIKRNVAVNSFAQGYSSLVRILVIPLLIKYMGAEAYGLIGFYSAAVAVFWLLNLGLTPALSREAARLKIGDIDASGFLYIFKIVKRMFITIAFVSCISSVFLAEHLANSWFKINALAHSEVVFAVRIMGIAMVFRWLGGLYISVLTGTERFIWYGIYTMLIATLRYVGVVAVMFFYGFNIKVYFLCELIVSLTEIMLPLIKTKRTLSESNLQNASASLASSSQIDIGLFFKFSISNAFSDALWIIFCQLANIILSGILSLSQYGYFSLAMSLANGLYLLSAPISLVAIPRLSMYYISGQTKKFIQFYREISQVLTAVACVSSVVVGCCAEQVLYLWTGNIEIVKNVELPLRLFAVGNAVMLICRTSFLYQYAKGNLTYHLIGSSIQLIAMVPLTIIFSIKYGGAGAGYVWLFFNILYLIIWVNFSHYKIGFQEWKKWMGIDVLSIVGPAFVAALIMKKGILLMGNVDKWMQGVQITTVVIISLVLVTICSSFLRKTGVLFIGLKLRGDKG